MWGCFYKGPVIGISCCTGTALVHKEDHFLAEYVAVFLQYNRVTMDSKYKAPPLVMNNVSNYQPAPTTMAGQQQCIHMVNS